MQSFRGSVANYTTVTLPTYANLFSWAWVHQKDLGDLSFEESVFYCPGLSVYTTFSKPRANRYLLREKSSGCSRRGVRRLQEEGAAKLNFEDIRPGGVGWGSW